MAEAIVEQFHSGPRHRAAGVNGILVSESVAVIYRGAISTVVARLTIVGRTIAVIAPAISTIRQTACARQRLTGQCRPCCRDGADCKGKGDRRNARAASHSRFHRLISSSLTFWSAGFPTGSTALTTRR